MSAQLLALLTNTALAVLKFVVGSLASSRAFIADAYNSAGDVVATLVAWGAFRYGSTPPDENHPYGHGNAEALAGLLIGGMLCATGAFISIDSLLVSLEPVGEKPGMLAVWAALTTACVKEGLYQVSIRAGRRTHSPTLLASARDHRADVVTSLSVIVGILLARNGYPSFDSLTGASIGLYILYLGFEPVRENFGILMQESHPELSAKAEVEALEIDGIRGVVQVRTQPVGGRYRMDIIIKVDGKLSVADAHDLAHEVEHIILAKNTRLTEVYVHVEPGGE